MRKHLIIGAAISALSISSAMAQSTGSTPNEPAAAQTPSTGAAATTGTVQAQKADQWLASKFKGTDVLGNNDKKIGSISDILFDKTGKIEAYVVSIGGFLGMGAKDVALAPSAFQVVSGKDGDADKLKVAMSENDLKQAPNFQAYSPPRTTTGSGTTSGSGGMGRPAGAPATGR